MRYLLNSPVLTQFGTYRLSPMDVESARGFVAQDFVSAVGHNGTARLLEAELGVAVPMRREKISMVPGDGALVLRLMRRAPEACVLSAHELARWPRGYALLECLKVS